MNRRARDDVKTFLMMLGAALLGALLLALGVAGYLYWQYATHGGGGWTVVTSSREEKTVDTVPAVSDKDRFLGTHGIYVGEFPESARRSVLAAGGGRIVGLVTSSGQPAPGVRLRLALNGAAMSQWATSGGDGRYEIAVPFGEYRIDGYELDAGAAQLALAGKIDAPRMMRPYGDATRVEQGRPGQGLDLIYVDPVKKLGPTGDVKPGDAVVTWQPYPAAARYRLQLVEQTDPREFGNQRFVFEWPQRPVVTGTRASLAELKVALKPRHYYTVEVEALDEAGRAISQSPRAFDRADFRVVEP